MVSELGLRFTGKSSLYLPCDSLNSFLKLPSEWKSSRKVTYIAFEDTLGVALPKPARDFVACFNSELATKQQSESKQPCWISKNNFVKTSITTTVNLRFTDFVFVIVQEQFPLRILSRSTRKTITCVANLASCNNSKLWFTKHETSTKLSQNHVCSSDHQRM